MKPARVLILFLAVFLLVACSQEEQSSSEASEEYAVNIFGESFSPVSFISVDELIPTITAEEQGPVQVKGEIVQVCQSKGCWLTLVSEDGEQVRVTFKDYGFFVPKDVAGREVILEGITWYDHVSVDHLRHYAEDAGDSPEEIEAITEPEFSYYIEASGVRIL